MSYPLWKRTELWYAKLLKGQRNPVALQQRSGKVLADVTSKDKMIAAEIKQSQNPPVKAIRKALAQAEAGKPATGYNAVAIFHQTGDSHDLDIVCMTLKTAKQLIPSFRDERE
jgi:hypothetical protein